MRGRKNAVKACEVLNEQDALRAAEVLKAPEGAKIPGVLKAPEGTKIPGELKAPEGAEVPRVQKAPRVRRHKTRKSRRDKKYTLAAMIRAAADPKKRAVMSRVWHRRQKRVDHITALVRLAIRYLNARDRTTIYRHK